MKSRRKNQTRSKSKSGRAPMRRHVLPKRHVSPKRHLSPKRHGATSGARLRSRTKTRGRSRKAMRGGMHTGDNSKNSSALPWIAGAAGAALLGTGGVIGVNKYKKLKQKEWKIIILYLYTRNKIVNNCPFYKGPFLRFDLIR